MDKAQNMREIYDMLQDIGKFDLDLWIETLVRTGFLLAEATEQEAHQFVKIVWERTQDE